MYPQEIVKGLIVCQGGGATVKNCKVEHNNTKIELHFHITEKTPNAIEKIKEAILHIFKTLEENSNENRRQIPDLSTLLEGDKRDTVVD